jgi:hypothetical protein
VLEDVAEDDHVEAVLAEGVDQVDRLDVADDQPLQVGAGLLGRFLVELEPRHRAAALNQGAGQIAGGTAHIEHPLGAADQLDHQRVAVVAVREVDVGVVPGAVHSSARLYSGGRAAPRQTITER